MISEDRRRLALRAMASAHALYICLTGGPHDEPASPERQDRDRILTALRELSRAEGFVFTLAELESCKRGRDPFAPSSDIAADRRAIEHDARIPVAALEMIRCIVCGYEMLEEAGPGQPTGGLAFSSRCGYGSAAFDPFDGTRLEVAVCDACLVQRGRGSRFVSLWVDDNRREPWAPDRYVADRLIAREKERAP